MKHFHHIALSILLAASAFSASAQTQQSGSSATMRRGERNASTEQTPGVTQRMQNRLTEQPVSDADMSWMKVVYRSLDLTKESNAPLYFPEQVVDGDENLFRIILRLLADGKISAYEYFDNRENFDESAKLKVADVLDRYDIPFSNAKGHTERNPRYVIEQSDVPTTEVLTYYVIERWEFDSRTNRMQTRIVALCPVLHRSDDYGMEAMRYPMFWVKYEDLRPYLATQNIFISDANNLPTCTYDDYFRMTLYNGDIYKTRNLRNRSMRQIYPDPDALARARDSIQYELDHFEDKLWVPTLEQLQAKAEAEEEQPEVAEVEEVENTDSVVPAPKTNSRSAAPKKRGTQSKAKPAKVKKQKAPKKQKEPSSSTAPRRSVRDRRR